MNQKVEQFIQQYKLFEGDKIQQTQLAHRFDLVEAFNIKPGMRVLEIGCGQGDTTAALAHIVGDEGKVVAIDIARGDYGAPFTLAQAHAVLKESALGSRISFHLQTDFLQFEVEQSFDAIVLSHCSWYFSDKETVASYLCKAKQVAKRLCFAEWDIQFERLDQRSHFLAVSVLALYSEFVQNDGNIHHVFNEQQIREMLVDAGFNSVEKLIVDASYLQDGRWEVDYANDIASEFNKAPQKIQSLVQSYLNLMNKSASIKSLNSFVLIGE